MLAAGLIRWKIIALVLGPAGVGIAGVIDQAAQVVLQLGTLNIPTAALRFLAIARESRGLDGFGWLFRTLRRVLLLATGVAALVAFAIYLVWPDALGAGMGAYRWAVLLALAAVPATGAINLLRNVLATVDRNQEVAVTLLVSSVLLAAGTAAGLALDGLRGAYLAALLVAVWTVWVLQRRLRPSLQGARGEEAASLGVFLRSQPEVVRFSLTLYAVGFTVPLGYAVLRWNVLGVLGERDAGFLAAAFTIAMGVRATFAAASTQYLLPRTSRDQPPEERAADVARYIRTLLLFLVLAALPLLLYPRELLVTLYSREFIAAVAVIGLFIFGEIVMAIGDAYRVLQLGLDDLVGYFLTTSGAVVLVALNAGWVVSAHGLRGAAMLQVVAALAALAWSIGRIRFRHRIRMDRRTMFATVYALAALAVATLVGRALPESALTNVALKAAIGAILLFGAWWMLPRAERAGVIASLPAIRRSAPRAQ